MTGEELIQKYRAGERDFIGSDLTGSNLRHANLRYADLQSANLMGADLRCADLRFANLRGANLDFSVWPLWCRSVGVTIDSRISRQLVYHAIVNMPVEDRAQFLADPVGYANGFHRVAECGKIEWEAQDA